MGRRTERSRSYISDAAKNLKVQQREDERFRSEQSLAEAERLLGTDAQIAGNIGGNAAVAPFMGRYNLNEGYVDSTLGILGDRRPGQSVGDLLRQNVGSANELMTQAQAAAESGDFATAQRLRSEADSMVTSGDYYPIIDAAAVQEAISFSTDPISDAHARLSSPSAQGVGRMIRDASQLLDYNSESSQRFRQNLNLNAERSIATERRAADRAIRDTALGAGGSRSPQAFAAIQARAGEKFATARAQILTDNARYFEEFSRAYAQDAFGFSQAWLQGSAGYREQFQGSLDQLTSLSVDGFSKSSALSANYSAESAQERDRATGTAKRIAGAVAMVAASVLAPGIGTVLGGALATAMSAIGGSNTPTPTPTPTPSQTFTPFIPGVRT